MTDQLKAQISAFVDDELLDEECDLFVRRICADDALGETANRYVMIGEAIRGGDVMGLQNLKLRIQHALSDSADSTESGTAVAQVSVAADSAPGWQRYLKPVAGIAVAASVAMAAVMLLQAPQDSLDGGELPSTTVAFMDGEDGSSSQIRPVEVPRFGTPDVRVASGMAQQSRMDQYLIRHKSFATGLGNPSILGFRDINAPLLAPANASEDGAATDPNEEIQVSEPQQ